ncbi:hypothetical protein ACCW92_01115 [Enterobacter soli]|uniref:hypothetical protein n=1 Tax=Enterobacter soli TaxID=885040 RepID=UPI003EDA631F
MHEQIYSQFYVIISGLVTFSASSFGLYCAFEKWIKRKEHFPRINFDINVEIIDFIDNCVIINVISILENKGVVPLMIKDFTCELRGILDGGELRLGDDKIRKQLNFNEKVGGGDFIPRYWDYSFVFPGVKTEYTFVTIVPDNVRYLLAKGVFTYLPNDETHHAGKVVNLKKTLSR